MERRARGSCNARTHTQSWAARRIAVHSLIGIGSISNFACVWADVHGPTPSSPPLRLRTVTVVACVEIDC